MQPASTVRWNRARRAVAAALAVAFAILLPASAVSWGQSSVIGRAAPHYQAVTSVIVHALTAGFFTTTTWCVAGGMTVTAIALLTGPYRWTTAIQAAIRAGGGSIRRRGRKVASSPT